MTKVLILFACLVVSTSCNHSKENNKGAKLNKGKEIISKFEHQYDALNIDSIPDNRYTITCQDFLIRKEKPIIFNRISIVDIFRKDSITSIMRIRHDFYPAYYFDLKISNNQLASILKNEKIIHILVAKIESVKKANLFIEERNNEDEENYSNNEGRTLSEVILDDYVGTGTLINFDVIK